MPGRFTTLRRWRYPISAIVDASLWLVALYPVTLARLIFKPSAISIPNYLIVADIAVAAQLLAGGLKGLYRGRRAIASFGEVILVITTSLIAGSTALVTVLVTGSPNLVPISAVLTATAYQMLGALGLRYVARLFVEGWCRSNHARDRQLIVFGAGDAGHEIVKAIQRDPMTDLDVVGVLEDNPTKRRLKVHGLPVLDSDDVVLSDIRDEAAVRTVVEIIEPHVVFHAAAHKQVTFLERFPSKGHKTNVEGTRNVPEAADAVDVETFVNISTDKAADPINTLGHTKREAEILTSTMNEACSGRYMPVRFGNVLGSIGSVIPRSWTRSNGTSRSP